jgi:hypothetical protein
MKLGDEIIDVRRSWRLGHTIQVMASRLTTPGSSDKPRRVAQLLRGLCCLDY